MKQRCYNPNSQQFKNYGGTEIILPNGVCMAEINGAVYYAAESINNEPTCPKWI